MKLPSIDTARIYNFVAITIQSRIVLLIDVRFTTNEFVNLKRFSNKIDIFRI